MVLEEPRHPRGSNVHGVLRLRGGVVDQRVESVKISLVEFTTTIHSDAAFAVRSIRPSGLLEANSLEEIPFAFPVPDTLVLSEKKNSLLGTRLVAVAYIRGLVRPRAAAELNIVEHREISAVRIAMKMLGFREQDGNVFKSLTTSFAAGYWSPLSKSSNSISIVYDPPESFRSDLAQVALHLGVERGLLLGNLIFQARPNELGASVEGLAGGKSERMSLQIPCGHLRDKDGQPSADAAVERMTELLHRVRTRLDNDHNSLLRGASSPVNRADELLRPTSGNPRGSDRTLLHPVTEKMPPPSETTDVAEHL